MTEATTDEASEQSEETTPEPEGEQFVPKNELPDGCYVTIQLASDAYFEDPVEAVENILLDIIKYGLGNRAVVVTDAATGQEYIVQRERVLSEEEIAQRMAAQEEREGQ